jgi:hypothetical protein
MKRNADGYSNVMSLEYGSDITAYLGGVEMYAPTITGDDVTK